MTSPIIISIKSTKLLLKEKNNIRTHKPYGVILFSRNILNLKQVKNLIQSIKSQSKKTYILIDQEGGMVNRFKKFSEFNFLNNYEYYEIYLKYPSLAKQLVFLKSYITSYYLNDLGISINTIPVLDLPVAKTIPMIKKRTFGPNIETNILLNKILLDASSYFGIMPVVKHIPGHGISSIDSHYSLPVSKASKEILKKHFNLFKQFNYLPLAMTAHIKYLNLDKDNIATFSPKIINKIIRNEINFQGLIMTDDLVMKANIHNITDTIKFSNKAGIDIMLDCSSDWDRYFKIIKDFNKTEKFKILSKIPFISSNKTKIDTKSININHYHDLYNNLIKLYGI